MLISVEDDATVEELQVIWEIERGGQITEQAELPRVVATRSTTCQCADE